MTNPLLAPIDEFIDYQAIRPEHIEPALDMLLAHARQDIEQLVEQPQPTWDSLVEALHDATEKLWRAWSISRHLNAVVNTPELREAVNACLPKVSAFATWMGQHQKLYAQYKALAAASDEQSLDAPKKRAIELALQNFVLGGAELDEQKRELFAKNQEEQATTSQQFSENVLDSTDHWALYITDEAQLDGIPDDVKAAAQQAAEKDGKEGWKLTLQMPCYLPVMQYAHRQELRKTLYKAFATIASDQSDDTQWDNSQAIEKLLQLRIQEAELLGFEHFAALQLQTRMADSAEQITEFLHYLAERSKPYAQSDFQSLTDFARQELGIEAIEPWDVAYVSEQMKKARYDYSEDEVKQYFTEPHVLQGLFSVAENLFGAQFKQIKAPTWHQDARVYEVSQKGAPVGYLYIDLYARQGKQSGAWVGSERHRRRNTLGADYLPIAYLTCNFSAPQNGRPALFTHDDVITLFHESGHALHHLLSKVDEPDVAAFSAVEWDAIELPSQFMENFCWDWSVVKDMSSHVDTQEPLPKELFERMLAAKNFLSGMQMVRQIEFALFDMLIHSQTRGLSIDEVLDTLDSVRQEVAVVFPPSWHRFPHHFSHLFAGGYAAGYYSYKWAEVLSADAFSAFEEAAKEKNSPSTLVPEVGQRFLDEILAVGGIRPSAESFRAFRGRDATPEALLRHSGLVQESAA